MNCQDFTSQLMNWWISHHDTSDRKHCVICKINSAANYFGEKEGLSFHREHMHCSAGARCSWATEAGQCEGHSPHRPAPCPSLRQWESSSRPAGIADSVGSCRARSSTPPGERAAGQRSRRTVRITRTTSNYIKLWNHTNTCNGRVKP